MLTINGLSRFLLLGLSAWRASASCDGVETQNVTWRAFQSVASAYAHALAKPEEGSRFVMCVAEKNRALAETLMLFQGRLRPPAQESGTDAAFLHYVINTNAEASTVAETADLRRLYRDYRNSLPFPAGVPAAIPGSGLLTQADLRQAGQAANVARYGRADVVPAHLLSFSDTAGHSWQNAVWMAEMSALAYWDRELREKQLRLWGFSPEGEIQSADTDTSGFLTADGKRLLLSFRGTSSLKNVLTDLQQAPVSADWAKGKIHRGFKSALDGVWPQITQKLGPPQQQRKELWITGHSLGAALAQLTALRLKKLGYSVRTVYTFGTPRAGDEAFADDYDGLLGAITFSHVNDQDVVTRLPSAFGYRHAGRKNMTCFSGEGHRISDCQATLRPALNLERDVENLKRAIRETTAFLPQFLRPQALGPAPKAPPLLYGAEFAQNRFQQHGSYEYLFKLVCAAVEYELWPAEVAGAKNGLGATMK